MRQNVHAVVVGLAVARGVLGLFQVSVESHIQPQNPEDATAKSPKSHSGASSWARPLLLSQNVIDGKSAAVCTSVSALFPLLVRAAGP